MKNITKIVAVFALILVASCGKDKTTTVDNRPTVNVKVSTPIIQNENFISTSGKIEAVQNANISTRIMGFVNNIPVKVGDKVSKGQLLISINSADISAQKGQVEASIIEAQSAFNIAEKDYNRYKVLFAENSASQKEMDDITAHFNMSKARLQAAKQQKKQVNAQFSYSNITAPFSGIVTGKYINKGDMANPGMPLLSIETPGNFQVMAMVPESEITGITTGTKVNVLIKSSNKLVTGVISEVSTSTKNTGGQYLVKVILDESSENLLSGMFASVQIPTTKSNNKSNIFIPTSAVIKRGELNGIYVVSSNNTALLRWLRLGKVYGENIEVLAGLDAEEQYVLTSESKLVNGSKLAIQ